ncbi:hypothetical protein ABEB36_007971 [Hypothenemus hampei]|uniref:Uncharacterized protein n=1 Tax=Hypothenemus hampei TaxID=57062 RepID=A0ABD1EK85_HYPHA
MPAVTFRLLAGSPMPDRSKESSQTKRTPPPVLFPTAKSHPFPNTYLPTPTPPSPSPGRSHWRVRELASREPDSPPTTLLTLILTSPLVLRDHPSRLFGASPGTDAIRSMSEENSQLTDAGLLGRPRSGSCGGGQAGPPRSSSCNRGSVEVVNQASRSVATGTSEKSRQSLEPIDGTPEAVTKKKTQLKQTPMAIHKEKLRVEQMAMKKFMEKRTPIMRSPPDETHKTEPEKKKEDKINTNMEKLINPFGGGNPTPTKQPKGNDGDEKDDTYTGEDSNSPFTSIYISEEESNEEINNTEAVREGDTKEKEDTDTNQIENTNDEKVNKGNKKRIREDTPQKEQKDNTSKKERYEDKAQKMLKLMEKMCTQILNLERILANTYKPKQELKDVKNKLVNMVENIAGEDLLEIFKIKHEETRYAETDTQHEEQQNVKELGEQIKTLETENKRLKMNIIKQTHNLPENEETSNMEELTKKLSVLELENKELKKKIKKLESNLPENEDVKSEEIDQITSFSELEGLIDRVWPETVYKKVRKLTEFPMEDTSWDVALDRESGRRPADELGKELIKKYPELRQLITDSENSLNVEYLINETRSSIHKGTERYIFILPSFEGKEEMFETLSKLALKTKELGRTRMAVNIKKKTRRNLPGKNPGMDGKGTRAGVGSGGFGQSKHHFDGNGDGWSRRKVL